MRYLLLAVVLATTGCFSSWAITQSTGNQRLLDEGTREARVPLPGVHERLHVSVPIAAPFTIGCRSTQTANDTVHTSGFRYGRRWKTVAAIMFALEAGIATAVYFGVDRADREKVGTQLAVGLLGVDALGTGVLFFVPRREVFRRDVDPVVSEIRTDCPAGLAVEVDNATYPVDAAGHISEDGELALDRRPPSAPLRLTYRGRPIDLFPSGLGQAAPAVAGSIEVPMGSLTQLE